MEEKLLLVKIGAWVIVSLFALIIFVLWYSGRDSKHGVPKNQNPPPPPFEFPRMSLADRKLLYMNALAQQRRMIYRIYGIPPHMVGIKPLEEQLNDAVECENYELAAVLRDQINATK